ncbi:CSF1 [Candida pseudojiufengensis]|uniref:CSF1 n=1 Tax=Candida pseudojiufengensis TaxID=497109 RepID=UPI0022242611|nr:CSF1 [Candida pseudojiufengensis]KAI5964047.1 CSF1 [Candida pseudojiufengensis]
MAFESQFVYVTSTSTISVSFWIYLVDWVLVLVLGLGFLFYFHKLLGFIFSFLFRLLLWKTYKVRVHVDSLKLSPLGGRLFIKNLTISSADTTISMLNITMTWRYWFIRLTKLSNFYWEADYETGGVSQKQNDNSPSRFLIVVDGLEIFMYNRTAAYDDIISSLNKSNEKEEVDLESTKSPPAAERRSRSLMLLLQILPIELKVKKGAIVIGNITTPTILVASYKVGSGLIDIAKAPNPLDPYRLLHDFQFDHFQIWMKPNIGYDKDRFSKNHDPPKKRNYKVWYDFLKATRWIHKRLNNEDLPPDYNWHGLKRYVGEVEEQEVVNDEQYAKFSLILDSPMTRIVYYYDSLGYNKDNSSLPEQGVEVEISNGTIHYGPWADKQRIPLQNMLFPSISKNSAPRERCGFRRDYDGFKFAVIVRDELVIRVPTRESSKDKGNHKIRPFGWLEIKVAEGSNIGSFTSFMTENDKWPNKLKIIFNNPEIRSSVNHDVLFVADSHEINADIALPLQWNGKCYWTFNQVSLNSKLFVLREHLLLFSDLFTDFASGEPQPYEYFRPFHYNINWKLINYEFYLNVNDLNIIDNPLDFENNKYLSFQGEEINSEINIPMYGNFSKKTTVSYKIWTPFFDLVLDTPPWHTVNAYLKETNVVGKSGHFVIDGSYTFYSAVEINTANLVEINCIADELSLKFYGFVIRYLFTLRENYFGDHIHFKTFEEYNNEEESIKSDTVEVEDSYWKMVKYENDVDVLFKFQVRNGLIILPTHLYSSINHIGLNFDMLDIDIRFCNYYMDMQVDFSPVSGVLVKGSDCGMMNVADYAKRYLHSHADMSVDGFGVHAHRMFGIPPNELTFWCKWDFYGGDWIIDSQPYFVKALNSGISNFGIGFSDPENALDEAFPPAFDAANFSFRCPKILIRLRTDSGWIELKLLDVVLGYNDLSNMRYSNKLSVSIPEIQVNVFNTEKENLANLKTSLVFSNICQKVDMVGRRDTQQLHVRDNDAPFHRCPFILFEEYRDEFYDENKGSFLTSFTLPDVAIPLMDDATTSTSTEDEETVLPALDYNDDDFKPSYDVDPDTEYDNFILELGDLLLKMDPKSLTVILNLMKEFQEFDIDSIMDEIGVKTIKMLNNFLKSSKSVKNLRIVNHILKVCVELDDESSIILTSNDLSVALSSRTEYAENSGNIHTVEEFSLALHLSSIGIDLKDKFKLSVEEIELWLEKVNDLVGSVKFDFVDSEIDLNHDWSIEFAKWKNTFEKELIGLDELRSERSKHASLVYALSIASSEYFIDHDPDVLTRPAYVLRAKKEHIRFFDGWKVVARLRHILRSLPPSWWDSINLDSNIPENAYDQVTDIFSRWRMWEANPQQRIYMFKYMFGVKESDLTENLNFEFLLYEFEFRSKCRKSPSYVNVEDLTISCVKDEVVCLINTYDGKITVKMLDTVKKLMKEFPTNEVKLENKKEEKIKAKSLNLFIKVIHFKQSLFLISSSLDIRIESFLCQMLENLEVGAISVDEIHANLKAHDQNIINQEFYKLNFVASKADKLILDVGLKTSKTRIYDCVHTLGNMIDNDVPYLKEFTPGSQKNQNSPSTPSIPFIISCNVKEFLFSMDTLNPLKISLVILKTQLKATPNLINLRIARLKSNLNYEKDYILEFQGSDLWTNTSLKDLSSTMMINSKLSLGYFKIQSFNLIRTMSFINKDLNKAKLKIEKLQSIIPKPESKISTESKDSKTYLFKINFQNNYLELSSLMNKINTSVALEGTEFNVSNVSSFNEVPIFGDFSVLTTKINLLAKSIPLEISNLLELNFAIKIFNDQESTRQNLQIESQFCRVCCSELIIVTILEIMYEVLRILPEFKNTTREDHESSSSSAISSPSTTETTTETPTRNSFEMMIYSRFAAFQFLSYNFCFGWLFNEKSKEIPGIIVGAEKFFAATEESLGKFTLVGSYISVANGHQSSNFFSTVSERNSLNRAFLPILQVVYIIEKESKATKHLKITVNGDEIDVRFLSTSIGTIIQKAAKSGTNVTHIIDKFEEELKIQDPDVKEDTNDSNKTNFDLPYQTIEFSSTFAGSNVMIYKIEEEQEGNPSLFLHAPAIRTAFKYFNSGEKKKLYGELLTSSSENTLNPKCVPVLLDLAASVKDLMHEPSKVDKKPKENDYDYFEKLLQDMELHIGVKIEKQTLTLSCEPTAKVAAIVGLENIYIQVNTLDASTSSLTVSILLDWISASLQHIYSRDISASMRIEKLILSSYVEVGANAQISSSGSLTNVAAYVNVKQYQDVDLFKDIWFPKELFQLYEQEDKFDETPLQLAEHKNISSKFKQVSTTYAFPWVVVFAINTINLEVDLGQSLGLCNLIITNFWALSKKSADWSQDLKSGIDSIELKSTGRLGGFILIEDMNLHTAISWKLVDGKTLDVPLISVSGGLNKFSMKISFDYHVIAIATLDSFSMDMYNRKSDDTIKRDHLFIATKFKTVEIYITSLTASNFVDISNTISRMIQDNKRSYKETLRDSSRKSVIQKPKMDNSILETIKKLETIIHVAAGKILVHVSPSSLNNSKVLVVKLDDSKVEFQQNEFEKRLSNELGIKFNDLKVSLSNVPETDESFIQNCSVEDFRKIALKAKGGSIFVFPSFKISMRTFEKTDQNLIEYLYQSTFNGTVDIRWNLGSVNFIREMYLIHSNALASRMEYRQKRQQFEEFTHNSTTSTNTTSTLKQQLNAEDPTKDIDDAIKETMEKVEKTSKYRYVALAPPIIEAPQLKELGNATPPLEWFGLNRRKFPNFTHELAIVNLQKLINEIEVQYSKMLGKA